MVLFSLYIVPGLFRLVDGDEGFYLMAARLVFDGRVPYHDFHYPQMPLLPYVYGAWMWLFGASWYVARLLSVLLSVALGLTLARHVERLTGRQSFGVGAAVVLAVSGFGLAWYTTVKTFALATLFVFASYVVVERRKTPYAPFIAGVLLALAGGVRLYLMALAPVLAFAVWRRAVPRSARRREIAAFTLGFAAGLLPTSAFALSDLELFAFNNLGVHAIRTDWGYVANWSQKFAALQHLFGISSPDGGSALQFAMLFVLSVAFCATILCAREHPPLCLTVGGAIFLVSIAPTPFYTQYMSVVLPFLIVSAALFMHGIVTAAASLPPLARRLRHAAVVVLIGYIALSPLELYRYIVSGSQVDGVLRPENAMNWRIAHIEAVGSFVDSLVPRDHPQVLSFWPGFFIGTHATVAPGFENQFTIWFADRLSPERRERYRFMSWPRLWYHVGRRDFPVVVIGNVTFPLADRSWEGLEKLLEQSGYVHIRTMGDARIYALRSARPA